MAEFPICVQCFSIGEQNFSHQKSNSTFAAVHPGETFTNK